MIAKYEADKMMSSSSRGGEDCRRADLVLLSSTVFPSSDTAHTLSSLSSATLAIHRSSLETAMILTRPVWVSASARADVLASGANCEPSAANEWTCGPVVKYSRERVEIKLSAG